MNEKNKLTPSENAKEEEQEKEGESRKNKTSR